MSYNVEFTRHEQMTILAVVERQLATDATKPTRNRKPLRPNDLSAWEIRIGKYRVFYDVNDEEENITIKAVGWKTLNRLLIRGKEFEL